MFGWRDVLIWSGDPSLRWVWPKGGDFNGDGAFTISDLWQSVGWFYFMPGDLLVWLFDRLTGARN